MLDEKKLSGVLLSEGLFRRWGCVEAVRAQSRMKMLEMFLERTNRINFAENYWNKFQPIACPTAGARKDYIHQ